MSKAASASKTDISSFFNGKITPRNDKGVPKTITKDLVEEQVLKFFISGNIPFNQADNQHFRTLVSWIDVKAASPKISRSTLRRRLTRHAQKSVSELHEILVSNTSKISLALDIWSTRTGYAFMGKASNS